MNSHLPSPDVTHLKKIQETFHHYQTKAFPKREPQFFALELAGECGELANCEKKIWRDPLCQLPQEKINEEAADVFIALINYCNTRNIDLENSVREKLNEIEKRRLAGKMGATTSSHT